MSLKSKLSFTNAVARNTSFSCARVLRSKPSFLDALFIHPNKTKKSRNRVWKSKRTFGYWKRVAKHIL